MDDLMRKTQSMQHEILDLMNVVDGHDSRDAMQLAYESLRLSWYMLRGDSVGINEKAGFVKDAYDSLCETLVGESKE